MNIIMKFFKIEKIAEFFYGIYEKENDRCVR